MGADDRAVEDRVFVVRLARQVLEELRPDPALGPAAEAGAHLLPVPEAFRQVALGNAGPIAIEHRLDEQAVVLGGDPDMPGGPGSSSLIRSHWSSRKA